LLCNAPAPSSVDQQVYGYDGRGNRTSETSDDCNHSLAYGVSGRPALLTGRSFTCVGSALPRTYQYDSDGRVTQTQSAPDSSGQPANRLSFDYSPGGAATETVYKAVNVNGAVYGYYYDALGRRLF
jgi:YD repeat-containing protein